MGTLGPARGEPLVFHWPLGFILLRLVPYALLGGCAFLRANREKRLYLMWLVLGVVWAATEGLRLNDIPPANAMNEYTGWFLSLAMESAQAAPGDALVYVFYLGFRVALLSLCAMFLLAPWMASRGYWRSFGYCFGVFAGYGVLAILCDYCFGWSIEVTAVLISFLACSVVFFSLWALIALWIRRWLHAFLVVAVYAMAWLYFILYFPIPAGWEEGMIFKAVQYAHLLMAIVAVLYSPFLILALRSSAYRERFESFFGKKRKRSRDAA